MEHPPEKWKLPDLVDFEVLLSGAEDRKATRRERDAVSQVIGGAQDLSRGETVRRGLRAWLEERRTQERITSGERVALALRFTALLAAVVGFLAGTSVMRGLLHLTADGARSYHIWIFLAVALGLQWLILLFSLGVFLFLRGKRRPVSMVGEVLGGIARWLVRKRESAGWESLWNPLSGSARVIGWRLTTLSQGMGVAFNAGLLAGFLGCLWFFKVHFYWESTFASLVHDQLFGLAEFLALPWSWTGVAVAPDRAEVETYNLVTGHFSPTEIGRMQWVWFLFTAMAVWGLIPRLILWTVAKRGEVRALRELNFQERRHRALWRQLVRHESGEQQFEGPADGAVVINVGGIELGEAALKEYLLRRLRVHAEEVFNAAVLDGTGEEEAFTAIRRAPLGVVFLVEGWSLSPKQMRVLYNRVRECDAERPMRFLVLGEIRDGIPQAPAPEDVAQWEAFVDDLRDPAVEVALFKPLQHIEEES